MNPGNDARSASASQSPGTPRDTPLKRSRVSACVHCRQSKLRCDAAKRPCARCERLSLKCEVVKGYKRVNKMQKTEELEKQVDQLKSVVAKFTTAHSTTNNESVILDDILSGARHPEQSRPLESNNYTSSMLGGGGSGPETQTTSLPLTANISLSADIASHSTEPYLQGASLDALTLSRTLGGIEIGSKQVDSLFQSFFTHYHPFLPFLDPSRSPNQYYDSSPLLFFSIVGVAARQSRDSALFPSALVSSLSLSVISLAWATIAAPAPTLLPSIQALIILSIWPYFTNDTSKENAHHFSSMALASAQKIGLHYPSSPQDFRPLYPHYHGSLSESETNERNRTWIVCNIVSQNISTDLGIPPVVSFNRLISLASCSSVPKNLQHLLSLQHFMSRATRLLTDNLSKNEGPASDSERHTLLSVLEEDLATLERTLEGETMEPATQLELQFARLAIRSYAFFDQVNTPGRKAGLLGAYEAASKYIAELLAHDTAGDMVIYMPDSFVRRLANAACIIFRILSTRLAKSVDASSGTVLFHSAISALRRNSIHASDLPAKIVGLLCQMWRAKEDNMKDSRGGGGAAVQSEVAHFSREVLDEPVLRVRSRASASVMYDCVMGWKEVARGWKENVYPQSGAVHNDIQGEAGDDSFEDMCWLWDFTP